MRGLYTLGVRLYALGIFFASWFNPKAKAWRSGRKHWKQSLAQMEIPEHKTRIWIHCASLGEFEQGRPIIERLRLSYPDHYIVLTFFSPSGYTIRSNYDQVDAVLYLPLDTVSNANTFAEVLRPDVAVVVKYEFWFNHLRAVKKTGSKLYLVGGIFRSSQHFFSFYGGWFRKQLQLFDHIFTQDEHSAELLTNHNIANHSIGGDPRFDRVLEIAKQNKTIPLIESFKNDHTLLVLGSSYETEEQLIAEAWDQLQRQTPQLKLLIAPHEIHESRITQIQKRFPKADRFSNGATSSDVLIMDQMGLLSSSYAYADLVLIGGGFGKGIHNVLEPATYGNVILCGPEIQKFKEAKDLENKGLFVLSKTNTAERVSQWLVNQDERNAFADKIKAYVSNNSGATGLFMEQLSKDLPENFS